MKKNLFLIITLFLVLTTTLHADLAETLRTKLESNLNSDYVTKWSNLLDKYTSTGTKNNIALTLVDYKNMRNDFEWANLISDIEAIDPEKIRPTNEKLAFWINIYNIAAAKMMIDYYPLKSIKDRSRFFSSVWDQGIIRLNKQWYSLGHIEHQILRKMGEPRIHFAIVCASVSCPDLRQEPYNAPSLNYQLRDQFETFIKHPTKGMRVDKKKEEIHLSSIFKWFENDFGYLKQWLVNQKTPHSNYLLRIEYHFKFMKYDWSSNGLSTVK